MLRTILQAHSGKAFFQKHSLPLIPFIPKLIMQVDDTWKLHILQAFTKVFKKCGPESSMKLVCLSAIEEMANQHVVDHGLLITIDDVIVVLSSMVTIEEGKATVAEKEGIPALAKVIEDGVSVK
ncbi:hypothetical protein Tco_0563784 [Tanacetum coccineum]